MLEKLRGKHPIIDEVLDYRMLTKLKSTYADGLLKEISADGRIHTNFQMTVTATGRLSSTEPNLQNIPVRRELGAQIRNMFVASPGKVLVDADYSQIELRLLAHIADDETMIAAFRSGEDIHAVTASQVFGVPLDEVTPLQRSHAKAVNFGIVYGISAFSLAQDIGVFQSEAKAYMDSYFAKYHGVRDYMDRIVEQAKADGYVTTLFGRRRDLPELRSSEFQPPQLWRARGTQYAHSGHGGGHHQGRHGARGRAHARRRTRGKAPAAGARRAHRRVSGGGGRNGPRHPRRGDGARGRLPSAAARGREDRRELGGGALMNYTICDAAAAHLPQLAALERACFSAPWTRAQLAGQLPDDRHVFLIAVAGETVLGYANFLHVLDEGDIGNVAVAPEHRRQGIADALLDALCARAAALDLAFPDAGGACIQCARHRTVPQARVPDCRSAPKLLSEAGRGRAPHDLVPERGRDDMIILAIESSCDETAVALVRDGREVLTDQVFSQADLHAIYGGVVPEIASRSHVEVISQLADRALE